LAAAVGPDLRVIGPAVAVPAAPATEDPMGRRPSPVLVTVPRAMAHPEDAISSQEVKGHGATEIVENTENKLSVPSVVFVAP